jgi:hypothetical protein
VLPAGPYQDASWSLVKAWNGRGLAADQISGLLRHAPGSPSLRALQQGDLGTYAAIERVALQGFVSAKWTHLEVLPWLEKLKTRMEATCRVDINGWDPPGVGTGFLVAPDLVLTAHHVIEQLVKENGLLAGTAVCRFSYLDDATHTGQVVRFNAGAWKQATSKPGGNEVFPGGPEPTMDQLDFALVQLDEPVAATPIPFAAKPADALDPLIVLQHPRRLPLRVAFGQVTGYNGPASRLKHNAGTEQGSSGAPCFNQELEVVGLHNGTRYLPQGELSEYNTAVPIHPIGAALHVHLGG